MSNIFGYPNYISGGSGGGTEVNAGAGLSSTTNPDGSITLAASGPFLTWYYSPEIANSRQVVGGNNVTVSTAIDGQLVISAAATGGGAPTVSSYIVGTTEASLPNSSVATEGNGITIAVTPGGAATFGVSTAITGADILTWQPGDTIFTDRRALILGSGLSADFGSNTLTLNVTGQNAGTVTSVGLSAPSWLTVGSTPVTTAGTISLTATNQSANTLLMGPSGGAAAASAFRKLLAVDLPISAGSGITLSTDATGGLNIASSGGSGSVTSVGLALPTDTFTITNSPVTGTGTLTGSYASQAANAFLGGPSGGFGTPLWRKLVGLDLPISAGSNIVLSTDATGGLSISSVASGGGGGTLTNFTAGSLSPLFTTNVGTPTTTPALTFTIAQGASGQFVAGPVSGSAANLALRALATSDLPVGIPATKIGSGTVDDLEFGYLDGVTSAIQTQFSNKQPLDATLTALAAYNTNGILTQTAADTFTGRTITGTANEVTVTNGNGVSGNPILSLPTGIDATKIADGSVTSTEFQYINTLSSNAQTQIDGKAANTEAFVTLGNTSGLTNERSLAVAGGLTIQDLGAGNAVTISSSALQPLDATLTALAAYNAAGFITQTGVDTFAGRTLAAAGGLTIQESGTVITISASGVTGGGGGFTANTITTSSTGVVSNSYFVDLSSNNVTFALPTAVSQGGKEIKVKIINNTVPPNTLTINCTATNGLALIDGSSSTITSQYVSDAWTFQSANGSAWYIF